MAVFSNNVYKLFFPYFMFYEKRKQQLSVALFIFVIYYLKFYLGLSPDVQNAEGETALQISAANGYVNIVTFLLNKGASVDLSNNYGWTPLMHAARYGHVEIVSLLIRKKAKINISNRLGKYICKTLVMQARALEFII